MLVREILEEVVTLPEAAIVTRQMGHALDRSNLLRYARSGRLVARKSKGAWLTTRSALQALILELATEPRGRPREGTPAWASFEMTDELTATLAKVDRLWAQVSELERPGMEQEQLRRDLTVETIYHTNRIEGNQLSLPEVRAVVQAFWAERESTKQKGQE